MKKYGGVKCCFLQNKKKKEEEMRERESFVKL
jgi:hypothetical protein